MTTDYQEELIPPEEQERDCLYVPKWEYDELRIGYKTLWHQLNYTQRCHFSDLEPHWWIDYKDRKVLEKAPWET